MRIECALKPPCSADRPLITHQYGIRLPEGKFVLSKGKTVVFDVESMYSLVSELDTFKLNAL